MDVRVVHWRVFRKVHSPGDPASLRPVYHAKTTPGPAQQAADLNPADPLQVRDPWTKKSNRTSSSLTGQGTPAIRPEVVGSVAQFQINTPPYTPTRVEPPLVRFH